MTDVTVAELKAKLSEYLRRAQAGEPIVVVRHGTPVARLVRYERPLIQITPPKKSVVDWFTPSLPPLKLDRDVLEYLWEERADRDFLGDYGPLLDDYRDE